jgi:hypothetical protein
MEMTGQLDGRGSITGRSKTPFILSTEFKIDQGPTQPRIQYVPEAVSQG